MTSTDHQLDRDEVTRLLGILDSRLRARGIGAAVFVVGGAAMAMSGARPDRLTQDVDAITKDLAVAQESAAIAREHGLPTRWLNSRAGMWMPTLPPGVLEAPSEPGLRITWADDGFLLATKLIAQRSKDREDIAALARRLGMVEPSTDELERHLRNYYDDEAALEMIIGGDDVSGEVRRMCAEASAALSRG